MIADFYPTFLEQSVHPSFNNQRLGFPPNRSMEVLYYNQTWLEELGFDGPPAPRLRSSANRPALRVTPGSGGFILRDDAPPSPPGRLPLAATSSPKMAPPTTSTATRPSRQWPS
jgi:hypothetical protein